MIKSAKELILAAQKTCQCIDAAGAKRLLDETKNGIILDVREPSEAEQSSIKHSINIPRGLLEMKTHGSSTHLYLFNTWNSASAY
ncbi:hypothetical protein A9Q80_03345 [Cycloclasticus sp. 46_83_sub15_T18]|nr:hypothetical protein A9Q80_03345 [Cycloclasticus sp. 46_83_sub15_T18]